jgi:hypothetical protein
MKVYGGMDVYILIFLTLMDVYILTFLTLALAGDECSVSHPVRFTPRGKGLCYPLDRRLGGPQSRSVRRGEKILDSVGTRTSTPRSASP